MRKIRRYIAKSVVGSIAIVLLVVIALDTISVYVDELDDVRGDYTYLEAFWYAILSIPSGIYDYLPLSCLIGCLIGLGLLANTSELVVMRAAGVTLRQLIWSVMRPVFIFILVGVVLGEWITPISDQYSESRRAIALGHQSALKGQRGVWNREGDEYMHFSAVLPNGKLFGVTRMKFDKQGRLQSNTYVESAIYQGSSWFEQAGIGSSLEDTKIVAEQFDTRTWYSDISPKILDVLVLAPEDLPMRRLYSYANYLERNDQSADEYRLALWQKALQPLAIASLVMIAISFIFGPLRQTTMGYRIFTGVIVGIVFRTSQDLLGPSSLLFGFSPLFAVLTPILVCMGIGLFMLSRAR